jgi:hypothetical protein
MNNKRTINVIYEQHPIDSQALDAPEFVPSGSTRAYESAFAQVQVVDGFMLREAAYD